VPTITTGEGHQIYYKDWGEGPVIVFAHGWPLNADAWDAQMLFFVQNGFRAIAHDRRGHGRSAQTSARNDMDGYADDLAALIETLDLRDVMLVGHSTGGGEITRYIGRHGTGRVAKAVLFAAVPPQMVRTETNPGGLPIEVFDEMRHALVADRCQFYRDFANAFFSLNRPYNRISEGVMDQFWRLCMQAGMKNSYECIKAFSETDFTEDLKKFDIPTLILHGEDDQVVPIADSSHRAAKLISDVRQIYYPDAPHGLAETHRDQFNADLLAFFRS